MDDATAAGGRDEIDALDAGPIKQHVGIIRNRRWLGYLIGVGGIGGVLWLVRYSFIALHELAKDKSDQVVIAGLVAHGVVAVAGVFFCYQLIRAAERMLFPHWWLKRPEVAKVMLGIEDPISAAAKIVEAVKK